MINSNKEDRKEMAKDLNEVRKLGNVNMFDRLGVIQELYNLGYDFTAEYIQEEKKDYINLLNEIKNI